MLFVGCWLLIVGLVSASCSLLFVVCWLWVIGC